MVVIYLGLISGILVIILMYLYFISKTLEEIKDKKK